MEVAKNYLKKHIFLTPTDEIAKLSTPLTNVGLSYFSYDKSYSNGLQLRLTNHPNWTEHFYKSELYKHDIFERCPEQFCSGHVFWSWLNRDPVFTEASKYNIESGITIIEKSSQSCAFYHFGTTKNNPAFPKHLMKNLSFLYRFIDSFQEKAAHLIKQSEKGSSTTNHKSLLHRDQFALPHDSKQFIDFLKKTEIRRLYLGEQFDNTYLTRREIDIVRLLIEGNKPVAISKELCLSQRTLEVHISHIKDKLNCNTLFELGYVLGTLGPKSLFPFY